jgi:hypothetical protein
MLIVIMLNVTYKPFMQNVVMLNVIMLIVVALQLVFVLGNLIQPKLVFA